MQFAPESDYLDWLIIDNFSCFRIECFDSDVLDVIGDGLGESNFAA